MEVELKLFQEIGIKFEGSEDEITVIYETDGSKTIYLGHPNSPNFKEIYSLPRGENQTLNSNSKTHIYDIRIDSPENFVTVTMKV